MTALAGAIRSLLADALTGASPHAPERRRLSRAIDRVEAAQLDAIAIDAVCVERSC